MPVTIADLIDRALAGFDALTVTAEPVDDEYQYVTDLGTVWRGRLGLVAAARGAESAPPGAEEAIDWLSTLPQVALAAIGEPA